MASPHPWHSDWDRSNMMLQLIGRPCPGMMHTDCLPGALSHDAPICARTQVATRHRYELAPAEAYKNTNNESKTQYTRQPLRYPAGRWVLSLGPNGYTCHHGFFLPADCRSRRLRSGVSLEGGVAVAESSAADADGARRLAPLPDAAGEDPPTNLSASGWLCPSYGWLSLCDEVMQHLAFSTSTACSGAPTQVRISLTLV